MKKHYALMLVILLFLLILCVTGCTETGGANVVYLPTRVNIRSYTSDYPNGRTVVSVVYKYDDSNHLQELVYQNYYGSYNFAVTTDGNGNVLTCDGSYQSSNDLISGIHESYTYTQDGKLLVSKSFPGPDSGTTKVRTYNSNGLLTQIKRTREHHVATHIVTMECAHDENGNIISIHNYRVNSGAKKLYSVTKFSYDEQGQRTEEVRYNGDGIRTCSIQYSYSDKGTIAHMESFTDDGQLWNTRMFTFDHTGNLIESHLISSSYESKTTYQYSYKKVPVSSAPQNIYVFHNTLPEIGISDWYDLVNVDS